MVNIDLTDKKTLIVIAIALTLIVGTISGLFPFKAYSVVVQKNASWVVYYDDRMKQEGYLINKFKTQDWNILTDVECGSRSGAKDSFNKFTTEYGNKPALCLIGADQTPLYGPTSPYYWAWFIYNKDDPNKAGMWNGEDHINGNDGKKYDDNEYVLVKFLNHQSRPVIIVWSSSDLLYMTEGNSNPQYIKAVDWLVAYAPTHDREWYIFNKYGVVDYQETLAPEPPIQPPTGNGDEPPVLDATSPEIEIISPTKNAIVRDIYTLRIRATDDESGVAKVEVYVRGKLLGEATPSQTPQNTWLYDWNTLDDLNGVCDIKVRAQDYAENWGESVRWVNVQNPGQPDYHEEPPKPIEDKIMDFIKSNMIYIIIVLVLVVFVVFVFVGGKIVMFVIEKVF